MCFKHDSRTTQRESAETTERQRQHQRGRDGPKKRQRQNETESDTILETLDDETLVAGKVQGANGAVSTAHKTPKYRINEINKQKKKNITASKRAKFTKFRAIF